MNRKFFIGEVKSFNDEEMTLEHIISAQTVDRDGEVLIAKGCVIDKFKKNPVVLFAHDYRSLPVGKSLGVRVEDEVVVAKTKFAPTELGRELYNLYKEGFMNAWSVGFIPIEVSEKKIDDSQTGKTYEKWELLEYSAVPVPSNPEALTLAVEKGLKVDEITELINEAKGVIPYKDTGKEDENAPWDGPKEVAEAEVEDLKIMCAWYDSEKPDIKASYKLPHHRAKGHKVVWRGVAAAMAALLGARGGVDVPDSDKKGIYNHLVKHYEDFGKEPPEFRDYESEEEILKVCGIEEEKAGRVLSEKNRLLIRQVLDDLRSLVKSIREVIAPLEELYEATEIDTESIGSENQKLKEVLKALLNDLGK